MRIGIDIRCLETPERTGVGIYTYELLKHIFETNSTHDFYLFTNAHNPKQPLDWSDKKVHTVVTRFPNKLFTAGTVLCNFPKIDRIIAKKTGLQLDLFFSPNLNFTALSSDIPHILMIHDLSFIFFPEYYTYKQRWWHTLANIQRQAKRTAHITTPSVNTKQDIIHHLGIPPEKITVLYPGVTLSTTPESRTTIQKKYGLTAPYILALSTAEPRKNILAIIAAFEYASARSTTPHLVLAGATGSLKKVLEKRISTSPYRTKIHQLGFIDEKDKPALLQGATVCLYPSFYEGFGFPVLEALQAGVPVITSNRSSLPEVAKQHAYMVNPHYPLEIAEAIENLCNNAEVRAAHTLNATEIPLAFSWKNAAAEWLRIVENFQIKIM